MLRAFFVHLSENRSLRNFAERSSLGRRVSGRFVAGTEISDAVRVTQAVNGVGMAVSIDNLGENVTNPDEARHSAQLYHQILDAIEANKLNANISLKLTHMGLDVDEGLARELVGKLVARASAMNPPGFVRVDMEGSPYTQRTLDFVQELHRMPGYGNSVGTVIQAYLKRSESDVEKLLAEGIRIRLCKGAYKEPASIAFESKADVDANFIKLMKMLMKSGIYHGIASHDEHIIREGQAFATRENISRVAFEFQMLYGIRRDLQQSLVREGWRMRVYVPFGTEWYPYFMRRLGERPANLFFIVRNMLRA
ncbi:MAG TPA: proline dehydrogenase family protein [Candidatus Sulfotelmatobacter sp.]|nr:proline dehydrogenase family protein [Candidatus Sulfotelmatobacter sp.]